MEKQEKSKNPVTFSVVIPVFNEEENIEVLHSRLTDVMNGMEKTYEIIFVDDGSTDKSFQIMQNLHQQNPSTKVIRFTRNFGHHIAITAGTDHSRGENVILIESDLQDKPEEIPKLVSKLDEGYDIVYGVRKDRKDPLIKKLGSRIYFRFLARLTNYTINSELTSFRVVTRKVIDYMAQLREHTHFHGGLLAWLGFPYALVEVEHSERYAGKSKYSLLKRINLAVEGVISFSDIPLRLITYFGLFVSTISVLLGIFMLVRYLFSGAPVAGFTSTIVSLFFIGGVLLIVLGVIGEYIGRIHMEVKKRPLYVIRDITE